MVDQFTTTKIIVDDKLQAFLLFSSLPDIWETLVVLVNNSASNKKLTLGMVTDKLLNEELRRNSVEIILSELNALVSKKQESQRRNQSKNSHQQNNDNPRGET